MTAPKTLIDVVLRRLKIYLGFYTVNDSVFTEVSSLETIRNNLKSSWKDSG